MKVYFAVDFVADFEVDPTRSALGLRDGYELEMMQSLSASRMRKNKARLTVSSPFTLAFVKADIRIETILSSMMLLLEELLLCLLYAKGLIDIVLNMLDRVKVLDNTK